MMFGSVKGLEIGSAVYGGVCGKEYDIISLFYYRLFESSPSDIRLLGIFMHGLSSAAYF